MTNFKKQLLFIIAGAGIITAGILATLAVSNRGAAAVGWWRFDEGQGSSAYDASENTNTATITGAVWKNEEECKFGKCLWFDGSGDYASVASHATLNPTDGVTVEAWVKPNYFSGTSTSATSTSATSSIVFKDGQYGLDILQGLPRFRAYANSTWYSTQADNVKFRETFENTLTGSGATFTEAFGYRALTPANLTAKKGVLITQSDNLQYSRGSQATPDGTNVVYENFNPNQGTLEFWVRPNWNGDDGQRHQIYANYYNDSNQVAITKGVDNYIWFVLCYGGICSLNAGLAVNGTNFAAGTWHHIVLTWDINAGVSTGVYYLDGALQNYSDTNTGTPAGVGDVNYIGNLLSGPPTYPTFNGTLAGRILNRPLTSTEVTALYASGAGSTDSWVCDSDCVWMGNYSD